ncbi:MAG: FkbM family methyltransferase [Candidatus Gracilibacteria bacterium]|jgi:FkbM family methyltransferase
MEKISLNFANRTLTLAIRDEADQSVMREIFKFGEYRIAEPTIKTAKIIIDAGAHAGFFTMYARALNKTAKIIAIEPEKANIEALEHHLKTNPITGVKIIKKALANKTEKRDFFISKDSHNHSFTQTHNSTPTEVDSINLRDIIKQDKISLLKMDIEGAEEEIIHSLTKDDYAKIEAIVMEYHNPRTIKKLESILRENRFKVQIFPSQFDKKMGFLFAKQA